MKFTAALFVALVMAVASATKPPLRSPRSEAGPPQQRRRSAGQAALPQVGGPPSPAPAAALPQLPQLLQLLQHPQQPQQPQQPQLPQQLQLPQLPQQPQLPQLPQPWFLDMDVALGLELVAEEDEEPAHWSQPVGGDGALHGVVQAAAAAHDAAAAAHAVAVLEADEAAAAAEAAAAGPGPSSGNSAAAAAAAAAVAAAAASGKGAALQGYGRRCWRTCGNCLMAPTSRPPSPAPF